MPQPNKTNLGWCHWEDLVPNSGNVTCIIGYVLTSEDGYGALLQQLRALYFCVYKNLTGVTTSRVEPTSIIGRVIFDITYQPSVALTPKYFKVTGNA